MSIVPEFPNPVQGLEGNAYPKHDMGRLIEYYDLLSKAGCFVVAKRRTEKYPVGNWKQLRLETYKRSQALIDQRRADVSGWCVITGYGRVHVLDLDVKAICDGGNDPLNVYAELQRLSPTAFVLATPANGVHLYYRIPEGLELLTNAHTPGIQGVDARGMGGQVVSLGGFNHYKNTEDEPDYCHRKGVPEGHTLDYALLDDGDYSQIPEMTAELYALLTRDKEKTVSVSETPNGVQYNANIETIARQLREKAYQPMPIRETDAKKRTAREAWAAFSRMFSLPGTRLDRNQFIGVLLSAKALDPSPEMLQFVLDSGAMANEPDYRKEELQAIWDTTEVHSVTGGTLIHYARKFGYRTASRFTLERVNERIASADGWTIPVDRELVLLHWQTGSGKSKAARKRVTTGSLILSPYTALADDVATSYNEETDTDGARSYKKPAEEHQGRLLCSTLQYASKWRHVGDFDCIVIEEARTLREQLCSPDSQMKLDEKYRGLNWLYNAFSNPKVSKVLVDANLTDTDLWMAETPANAHGWVVRNDSLRQKTPVQFVSYDEAISTILGLADSNPDAKIWIPCDTQYRAAEIADMLTSRYGKDSTMLITRMTSRQPKQRAFVGNVEAGAKQYRFVVYNTSMGVGVSLENTVVDLVVLFAEYLNAATLIQLLNRPRQQLKALCVFDIQERESREETEIRADIEKRFAAERTALTRMLKGDDTYPDKSERARWIDELYIRTLLERQEQYRAPFWQFTAALEADGRAWEGRPADDEPETTNMRKEIMAEGKETWREGINLEGHEELPEMSELEYAQSVARTTVDKVFGITPDRLEGYEDADYVRFAEHARRYMGVLTRSFDPQSEFADVLIRIADRDAGKTTVGQIAQAFLLLVASKWIMGDIRTPITHEMLVRGHEIYNATLSQLQDAFQHITGNSLTEVRYKYPDPVEHAIESLRIILRRFGIQLERHRMREGGRGKQEYVMQGGYVVSTYTVKHVDLIIAAVNGRRRKKGLEALVEFVFVTPDLRVESELHRALVERGLLEKWAAFVQQRGIKYAYAIAQELLLEGAPLQW